MEMLLLDIAKAFNCIDHELLFRFFFTRQVYTHEAILKIVHQIYSSINSKKSWECYYWILQRHLIVLIMKSFFRFFLPGKSSHEATFKIVHQIYSSINSKKNHGNVTIGYCKGI